MIFSVCGQLSFHLRSLQMDQHNKAPLLSLIIRRIQGIGGEQFGKNHHEQKPLEKVHKIDS